MPGFAGYILTGLCNSGAHLLACGRKRLLARPDVTRINRCPGSGYDKHLVEKPFRRLQSRRKPDLTFLFLGGQGLQPLVQARYPDSPAWRF